MLKYALAAALLSYYVILVRILRYRRINELQEKHGATSLQFKDLNYRDAQSVLGQMGLYECPWVFLSGKDFAFLRAFAIPGISKVSVGAKEMVDRVGKRYADTTVLVGEFLVNDLDSERACVAINRMNWIHSRYGNRIQMDQMVYTLCLLICEALHWIDKYDWRSTTALEKHASWVFWYEVGKRMGLTDVPQSFEDCAAYIQDFEERHMSPTEDNALIAKGVFSLYASTFPSILAPAVRTVLTAFMDSRLSGAFKLSSRPTAAFTSLLASLLILRKYFVRYLMLPRYSTLQVFGNENEAGFRAMSFWEIEPWYVPDSKALNWFHLAYVRLFGLPEAGDEKFRPQGYKLHEIGPKHLEGKGGEDVLQFVKSNQASAFTTFGQFENKIYAREKSPANHNERQVKATCPMAFDEKAKLGFCPIMSA